MCGPSSVAMVLRGTAREGAGDRTGEGVEKGVGVDVGIGVDEGVGGSAADGEAEREAEGAGEGVRGGAQRNIDARLTPETGQIDESSVLDLAVHRMQAAERTTPSVAGSGQGSRLSRNRIESAGLTLHQMGLLLQELTTHYSLLTTH